MSLLEKEWFIEAPWGKICIVAWGDCSSPPVLLCHGTIDSAACFRPLVKLLPKDYYYIAMEFPGNGKSDRYPPGLMVNAYDLVYTITVVVRHFRWKNFRLIAHSLGTVVGFLYQLSYPSMVSHVVNLDPLMRSINMPPDQFASWYHTFFTAYYKKYDQFNTPRENAPKYKWKEAIDMLVNSRKINEERAIETLERISEPAGDGFIRFTYDQRMKLVTHPPISADNIKMIFTSLTAQNLTILSEESIKLGGYEGTPFMFNESEFPRKNYKVFRVDGGHNVHFSHPETVAGYVSQFLLHGIGGLESKAKL